MLLQFSVTNHRSIRNTATISMLASPDKSLKDCLITPDNKKQLVPVLALYGANAAGKSNLLHALLLMKEIICGIYAKPLKGAELPQEPFAFVSGEKSATHLEIIYYYKGIKYAYGFSFNKKKIITEYLFHWPNGREALIFERKNDIFTFRENIQEQNILASRTADNRLYLVSSNEWNCPQTEKAYSWFLENLNGLTANVMIVEATLKAVKSGGNKKQKILNEMLHADLGISDVIITGAKESPNIITVHSLVDEDGSERTYNLQLKQESMGTQRFFSRIGTWMECLDAGTVLVVDELETSMHPLLTRHLIEMIQDPTINRNQAQLLFTTHDTGLLDQKILRRDQVWFAEKNERNMETDIYAMTDFSPRKGENIKNGYLQGRYGAIPFIGGASPWDE